jgi:hypothetical protein
MAAAAQSRQGRAGRPESQPSLYIKAKEMVARWMIGEIHDVPGGLVPQFARR